ncbi:amino acid adenylation domain-containing protein [Streptomyces sp. NBC_00663]
MPQRGRGIHQLVGERARTTPSAAAVTDGDGTTYTYAELDLLSARLARTLLAHGIAPDDRVCLLLPKSAVAVSAMLAVLRCGAVYVPLDPRSPTARLRTVLRRCAPRWIIADPVYAAVLEECRDPDGSGGPRVLWSRAADEQGRRPGDVPWEEAAGADDGPCPELSAPSGLAYIMFTSGSTGVPKGVPITHDSVAHFARWLAGHFDIGAGDRLSGHPAFHFDLSVLDVYTALTSGAELRLVPDSATFMPERLAGFIRDARLTQWCSVPSVLVAMRARDVVGQDDFPELRRVMWCGDELPADTLGYWMRRLPHVRFTNLYGPTEATVASAFHTVTAVPDDREQIPIGRAIPGEGLAVFTSEGRLAEAGVTGDLCISGAGLTPGYWRDPDGTARSFFEFPAGSGTRWYRTGDLARTDSSGLLSFRGRQDRQIKSLGYRIELDEVALAVNSLAGVDQAAVVAVPTPGFEGRQICAACTTDSGTERDPALLRAELLRILPAYMVPTRWLWLPRIPVNANGKTDHRALERRFAASEMTTDARSTL